MSWVSSEAGTQSKYMPSAWKWGCMSALQGAPVLLRPGRRGPVLEGLDQLGVELIAGQVHRLGVGERALHLSGIGTARALLLAGFQHVTLG